MARPLIRVSQVTWISSCFPSLHSIGTNSVAYCWETTRTEWTGIRVIAHVLSVVAVPVQSMRQHFLASSSGISLTCSQHFNDILFHHIILWSFIPLIVSPMPQHFLTPISHHFSSSHHLIIFLALIFSSCSFSHLAPEHLGWFLVWVATPLIHPFTRMYSRRNPGSLVNHAPDSIGNSPHTLLLGNS